MNETLPRIVFQGKLLPSEAYQLDILANPDIVKGLSEEQSVWWWRFTICIGIKCDAHSDGVLYNARKLLNQLTTNSEQVLDYLEVKYPTLNGAKLLEGWETSLKLIVDQASRATRCVWFGTDPTSAGDAEPWMSP